MRFLVTLITLLFVAGCANTPPARVAGVSCANPQDKLVCRSTGIQHEEICQCVSASTFERFLDDLYSDDF
jgi:hypothetical protein